LDLLPDNY